jgi:hypothetical protein
LPVQTWPEYTPRSRSSRGPSRGEILWSGEEAALKTQEQDPAAGELSFLERLGLLVDEQWSWRENQALARRLQAAKLKGACVEDIDYRAHAGWTRA